MAAWPMQQKGLVNKSKNGVLDGGIPIEDNIGGVEVFVIDKFSCWDWTYKGCVKDEEGEDETIERHSSWQED